MLLIAEATVAGPQFPINRIASGTEVVSVSGVSTKLILGAWGVVR